MSTIVRERLRETLLIVWVFATLSFSWMYSDVRGPNEFTRAYLTSAIVDDHTIHLDHALKKFGHVYDLASFDGHYYSDKAPGSSFVAAPLYALASHGDPPDAWHAERIVNLVRNWLMIPLGVLGFVALRRLLRRLACSATAVDLVSLGYVLGSSVFHYSTAYYGHVMVATFLLGALLSLQSAGVLVPEPGVAATRGALFKTALAGALAGLSGFTEYQATVLAVLLLIPVLMSGPGRYRSALAYLAGATPFAVALLAYNHVAFGGPFELGYHHLVAPELRARHSSGLAGATLPTVESLVGLLFSAHRGIITQSPWTAFGLVGAVALLWRRERRALGVLVAVATLYMFVAVASSSVWHGGWASGARLMIPVLPLLAITAAYVFDAALERPALAVLARASILVGLVYQQLNHVTFSELPPELKWPLHDVVWPVLESGGVAPNLACKLVALDQKNLIPLACSVVLMALFVGTRGVTTWSRRAVQAVSSIVLAAAVFGIWWSVETVMRPQRESDFGDRVARLMRKEKSCAPRSASTP